MDCQYNTFDFDDCFEDLDGTYVEVDEAYLPYNLVDGELEEQSKDADADFQEVKDDLEVDDPPDKNEPEEATGARTTRMIKHIVDRFTPLLECFEYNPECLFAPLAEALFKISKYMELGNGSATMLSVLNTQYRYCIYYKKNKQYKNKFNKIHKMNKITLKYHSGLRFSDYDDDKIP